jgi:phosphomannomutase
VTLLDDARRWRDEDPDPDTRAELDALLQAGDTTELADRFAGRLEFGTAGLRGAMGAGPNRMNVATVRYAAAGLGRYLAGKGDGTPSVVVGFDARHRSADFAVDSAAVLAATGVRALLLPRPLPTPVLAFAVRHLGTDAGVMVTASHNPANDNGYKVYAGDGAQIVPPVDAEIAAAIASFTSLQDIPLDEGAVEHLGEEVLDAYVGAALALVPGGPRDVVVTYTPMHGVGGATFVTLADRAGFTGVRVVAAQAEPDPDFPTVSFPNPEEPGALDLAIADAVAHGADLVVANDPDADRLAVALPSGAGGYRRLTGDELGCLLAEHLLRRAAPPGDDRRPLVATTVVSSRLLARIAADHGAEYAETLTGFKWLVRPGLEHPELRPVLAYEEALGYAIGELVRDKDGLTAGLTVLALAAEAKAAGRTLADDLDELARRHGVHATAQLSLRDEAPGGLERIRAGVGALRSSPPARLADREVTAVTDLLAAHDPPTDAVVLDLDGGARVVVRPSGTEPKLKAYLEVVAPDRPNADRQLAELLDAVRSLLEQPRA